MTSKEIKITVPEGYEIDEENSTFEGIKFKKKTLTYEDVALRLFANKDIWWDNPEGNIRVTRSVYANIMCQPNNAATRQQIERLLALNKLMNVAEYLNEKTLDWDNQNEKKWLIYYNHHDKEPAVDSYHIIQGSNVYFDSAEHAKQAIEILGEDTIKTALGVF